MNLTSATTVTPAPTDPAVNDPVGGIPNWSTRPPVTVGHAILGPRGLSGKVPFALSSLITGSQSGYASLADAVASIQQLSTPGGVLVGIAQQGDRWFGHQLWSHKSHVEPLEPSTRLSGATITTYSPMLAPTEQTYASEWIKSIASPFAGSLQAVVAADAVWTPHPA